MNHLKILNVILLAVVIYFLFVQAKPVPEAIEPETIRAKSIEIVDDNGVVRASIDAYTDGETVFRLKDSNGEIKVKIGAGTDGSGLLLLNEITEPGIHMLSKRNHATIAIFDHSGNKKIIEP